MDGMKRTYDVVIVGGGAQGLSLAFNLAQKGVTNVAVLDKGYIGSGASGRNGEMIRSAFGADAWIRLFDRSLNLWETLAERLDFNVMFTRCGYLVMASDEQETARFKTGIARQNSLGLPTRMVDAAFVKDRIPALNPEIVRGGIYQHNAGVARHDALVWAYQNAARRLGVDIFPFTEVVDVEVAAGRVCGVKTGRGDMRTRTVVNAAGACAEKVGRMAGVSLPLEIFRLEMLVTEPLKPFLPIALSVPGLMSYMHQTARGEFAGGAEPPGLVPHFGLKSTLAAARDMAAKFVRLFPGLQQARLMRQWAGVVGKTPDRGPVLGAAAEVEGFFQDVGWGGYGFMGAPVGGELLSELIVTGSPPDIMRPFNPQRFERGELVLEPTIIGVEDQA